MTVQHLRWNQQESRLDKVWIALISPKITKSFMFWLLCPQLKRNSVRLMGYFCFLFLFKSFFWVKTFEWSWTTKWYLKFVFSVDQGPKLGVWAAVWGGVSPLTTPRVLSQRWPNHQGTHEYFPGSSSMRPSVRGHGDLRRLGVALVPLQSNRTCSWSPVARKEETLVSTPFP